MRYAAQMNFIASLLFAAQLMPAMPALQEQAISYHDHLLKICEDRAGRKCCRASVHAMREEQARLRTEGTECPEGLTPMSLACPASLQWCSFRTVDEVRGEGARGDKLK